MPLGNGDYNVKCPSRTPLLEFSNNVAYSNKRCARLLELPHLSAPPIIYTFMPAHCLWPPFYSSAAFRSGLHISGDYRPRFSPCGESVSVPARFDSLTAFRNAYSGATLIGATPVCGASMPHRRVHKSQQWVPSMHLVDICPLNFVAGGAGSGSASC